MGPPEIDPRGPPRVVPRPPQRVLPVKSTASPVPIHIVDCTLSTLTQQHPSNRPPAHQTQLQPPPMLTSPLPSLGSNHHQLLLNRFGKPCYASVAEKKGQELQVRRHHVRDLREESERALEALIVDRRLLQREKVIEMTTATLDIDVGLQRMHFERELHVMHTHAALEQQRHTSRRRKLTRAFETTFVAQSGALMRRAARAAVASSLTTEEQEQHRLAAAVKVREAEAHERRCNAKSCWFVRNRMDSVRYFGAVEGEKAERNRLTGWRQWMKEDKDKKKMLRLM